MGGPERSAWQAFGGFHASGQELEGHTGKWRSWKAHIGLLRFKQASVLGFLARPNECLQRVSSIRSAWILGSATLSIQGFGTPEVPQAPHKRMLTRNHNIPAHFWPRRAPA